MGMVIYSIIVMQVTTEVLFAHSIYNAGCIFFACSSLGSFFAVYAAQSSSPLFPELYGTLSFFWNFPQYYFLVIFLIVTQVMIQTARRDIPKYLFSEQSFTCI
jgi:hypothetical protein